LQAVDYNPKKGRIVPIYITANPGAMKTTEPAVSFTTDGLGNPLTGFVAGATEGNETLDVFFGSRVSDVKVTVTRNSRAVGGFGFNWGKVGRLDVSVPANLAKGRYVVRVTHTANEGIFGEFVINNGNDVGGLGGATGAGVALMVFGLLGLSAGLVLVLGPRVIIGINARRYKLINDKIYGKDPATIRKLEKEMKAKKEAIKKGLVEKEIDPERSFQEKFKAMRQKHMEAARAGMTMAEYGEIESQQKNESELAKGGMKDVRHASGGVKITEDAENIEAVKIDDELPESGVVQSILEEHLMGPDQFQGVSEEVREEALAPINPVESGILGRIRKFTGDDAKPTE
jgi:hypothetical protein